MPPVAKADTEVTKASWRSEWSMEWIAGAAALIFLAAFCLSGHILPRLYTSQCTAEDGMCTPGECACSSPLIKRGLVTQDAVPCSQCISAFCPAVTQSELTCSTGACECEDLSWPRTNIGTQASPCWQCVHPHVDVTLREGSSATATCLTRAKDNESRIVPADAWNSSDCIVFRYTGAVIAVKSQNESCLSWNEFGGYWKLEPCSSSSSGVGHKFKQHAIADEGAPKAAAQEMFCTGPRGEEFCLEPAEYMCTTDTTQCSTGNCRCEDPSHARQELQTLNGSSCSMCSPSLAACPLSPAACSVGPCQCSSPGLVKVRHPASAASEEPCFSCRPASSVSAKGEMASWGSWVSTAATFVLCVLIGVAVGCGLRRFWAPTGSQAGSQTGRQRGRRRGAADVPRAWSERWAEHLEDGLEAMYSAVLSLSYVSKPIKRASHAVCCFFDACDDALEPFYEMLDVVIAKAQEAFEALKEQCVGFFAKDCPATSGKPETKAAGPAKAHKKEDKGDALSRSAKPAAARSSPLGRAVAQMAEASRLPQDLTWDPLSMSPGGGKQGPDEPVTIPREWMNLVGPGLAAKQAAAAAAAAAAAQPTQTSRGLKRLQQRREAAAAAAAAAEAAPQAASEVFEPVDETWIDDLEKEKNRKDQKKPAKRKGKQQAPLLAAEGIPDLQKDAVAAQEVNKKGPVVDVQEKVEDDAEDAEDAEDDEEEAQEKEAQEPEASATDDFCTAEDLMKLVGATGDGDGFLNTEMLFSEAMHGLFLLASDKDSAAKKDGTDIAGSTGLAPAEKEASSTGERRQRERPRKAETSEAEAEAEAETGRGGGSRGGGGRGGRGAGPPPGPEPSAAAAPSEKEGTRRSRRTRGGTKDKAERVEKGKVDAPASAEKEAKVDEAESAETPIVLEASSEAPPRARGERRQQEPGADGKVPLTSSQLRRQQRQRARALKLAEEKLQDEGGAQEKNEQQENDPEQEGEEQEQEQEQEQEVREHKQEQQHRPEKVEPVVQVVREERPLERIIKKTMDENQEARKSAASGRSSSSSYIGFDAAAAPYAKTTAAKEVKEVKEVKQAKESVWGGESEGPRNFAEIVAGRPLGRSNPPRSMRKWSSEDNDEYGEVPKPFSFSKPLDLDAPEFVPFSMMHAGTSSMDAMQEASSSSSSRPSKRNRRGRQAPVDLSAQEPEALPITTVMISGIHEEHSADSFRQVLESWGLMGTYNFFYMPPDRSEGSEVVAYLNFIDPAFALLCQALLMQDPSEGILTPFYVQGFESVVEHFNQDVREEDLINGPLIIPTETPSEWALAGENPMLNSKFSPQIREQFHKTKLCVFNKKNKCALGSACPFAHTKEELAPAPDLAKTKLCYNFFRRKCHDPKCKFAHGYSELRATDTVFKTELCRWWAAGSCKAGASCRYAHGDEELRALPPMMEEGTPFMMYPAYMDGDLESMTQALSAGMGFDPMGGLAGIWEDGDFVMPQFEPARQISFSSTNLDEEESVAQSHQMQDGFAGSHDGMSETGLSDISSLRGPGPPPDTRIRRQQTAPPTFRTGISELPAHSSKDDFNIVLRIKGTFMEAVHVDDELPSVPMHRSWSDGDLPQLSQAMESESDGEL